MGGEENYFDKLMDEIAENYFDKLMDEIAEKLVECLETGQGFKLVVNGNKNLTIDIHESGSSDKKFLDRLVKEASKPPP